MKKSFLALVIVLLFSFLGFSQTSSLLSVADNGSPESAIIVAGTSDVPVLKIKFFAGSESVNVFNLRIKQVAGSDYSRAVDGIKIGYKNQFGQSTHYVSTLNGDVADFINLTQPIFVAANGMAEVDVYTSLKTISGTSGAYTGDRIQFEFRGAENFYAEGLNTATSIYSLPTNIVGSEFMVRKCFPTFEKISVTSPLVPGQSNLIYKFKVTASQGSTVGLKKIPLEIKLQGGAKLTSFIVMEDATQLVVQDCGTQSYKVFNSDFSKHLSGDDTLESRWSYLHTVNVVFNDERMINAGASKTYSIYATVVGTYYNINIRLYEVHAILNFNSFLKKKESLDYWLSSLDGSSESYSPYIWSDCSGWFGNGNHVGLNTCNPTGLSGSNDWADWQLLKGVGSISSQHFQSSNYQPTGIVEVYNIKNYANLPANTDNVPALGFSIVPREAFIEIKNWRLEVHALGVDFTSATDDRIYKNGQSLLNNIKIKSTDGTFSTDSRDVNNFTPIPGGGLFTQFTDALSMNSEEVKNFQIMVDTKTGLADGKYYFVLGNSVDDYVFSPTSIKNTSNNQYVTDIVPDHAVRGGDMVSGSSDFIVSVYQGGEDLIDTFYVLPGEWWFNQFGLQSQPTPMSAIQAHINVDGISYFNTGRFYNPESDSLNYWKLTGGLASWNLLWMPNFSSAVSHTKWLCSMEAVMRLPVDSVAKIEVSGRAANVTGNYGYYSKTKYLKGRDGIRGDINQDGIVNQVDVDALVEYNDGHHFVAGNWDVKYTLNGINMGLGAGFFPYPEFAFNAMINIYVHNPNDPILQGLGIGQLFTANRQVTAMPVTFQQTGNNLSVQTQGNVISVVGELNGQPWQKTYMSTANIVVPGGLKIKAVDAVKVPSAVVTGVEEMINKVQDFNLEQNYPNPFNPSTAINYSVPSSSFVTLKVYDVLGKEVATLVNDQQPTGNYSINFEAGKLASGVYIYQLRVGKNIATKKMVLMK